jgi:hypothetical protein
MAAAPTTAADTAVPTPVLAAASTMTIEAPTETAPQPAAGVTLGPEDELPEAAPAAAFADQEIDDLVDEVQAADTVVSESTPEEATIVDTEDEQDAAPEVEPAPTIAPVEEAAAPPPVTEQTEVTLTEVASDDDLFGDPNLEVAQLAAGQAREIVIPVEVGDRGAGVRRYKLSLKLRLDPVD